jgi:3',5'-cyclic-AMP phosphodiesterase
MLLDRFIAAMRDARPACIVDLGDRINSVAAGQDGVRERYVRRRLEDAGVPVYHVLGNTDVEHLPKHDALAAVKKGWAAELIDLGPLRLVLLDTVDPAVDVGGVPGRGSAGGAVSAAQIDWLRAALAERDAACLVFGHHPLDEPALVGHHYFAARPSLAAVQNRADVRMVLEGAPAVAAVFSGHLHWTRAEEINGIPYVTIGSLVDTAYTGGEPAGAYALVTVGPETVEVGVFGRAPAEFKFPRRPQSTARR